MLFPLSQVILVVFAAVAAADGFLLFQRGMNLVAKRVMPKIISNGNEQKVEILLLNKSAVLLEVNLIDEMPYQLQIRDFKIPMTLKPYSKKKCRYSIKPVERGDYVFGNINLLIRTKLGLIERKYVVEANQHVAVYPSIAEMKKHEISTFAAISQFHGIKKIRKVGHSMEFDNIKEYVIGDDYQSVNWKATGRANKLMVNHYEDEKSQQIYCIIDKSRVMKLPFHGMSLLEYAINSTLVISNTILRKYDKAGLITFSSQIDRLVKAERDKSQLRKILAALYNEKTNFSEANYERLYQYVTAKIQVRSLLFLFTNFESDYALERNIAVLRRLNARHLLVVVFFENSELKEYAERPAETLENIYNTTIARKLIYEKLLVSQKLHQYGIQSILTKPENLSVNLINKYLELKGRGII